MAEEKKGQGPPQEKKSETPAKPQISANPEVLNHLVHAAFALASFNVEKEDLNQRLNFIQQLNKEYNTLLNKVESKEVTVADVKTAAEAGAAQVEEFLSARNDLNEQLRNSLGKAMPSSISMIAASVGAGKEIKANVSVQFTEPVEEEEIVID